MEGKRKGGDVIEGENQACLKRACGERFLRGSG
jgi:hypothetical protein